MFLRTKIYKSPFFWLTAIFLLFGFTRITNLTILPIFTDEAIYIRWAQIGSQDAAWRFISLVDGKQPLFTWILMILLKFIKDPLWAGRFVSVLAGVGSFAGIYFLTKELFQSKWISVWACLIYVLSPFSLMYDRLALYDSVVAAFSIWNLYLGVLLVRNLRLDIALILGMTLGAGMLNKTSGFLSLYLLPVTLFLFAWNEPGRLKRLWRWTGLVLVAVIISQLMYNVLRLSPLFHMIKQKDAVFIYPLAEWLTHPFDFWLGNLKGLFDWLIHYLTVPIFVMAALPIAIFWRRTFEKLVLMVWSFAPVLGLAFFGKVLYPRFVLFTSLPLIILAAISLDWLLRQRKKTLIILVAMFIIFFPSVSTDYFILTNPRYALIPWADKGQLMDDWPAGWGVPEVNTFLTEQATRGKIIVYTEGTFGLMPYALEIYLVNNPNIKINGIWPLPQEIPPEIIQEAKKTLSFLVLNQSQEPPRWPLQLVSEYQKGNRVYRKLRLYKIEPSLIQKK